MAGRDPAPAGGRLVSARTQLLYDHHVPPHALMAAVPVTNASGIRIPPGWAVSALGLTVQQFTNILAFIYALPFVLEVSSGAQQLAPSQRDSERTSFGGGKSCPRNGLARRQLLPTGATAVLDSG